MGTSEGGTTEHRSSLSQSIVEAVAEREGVDVTEVEPPEYEPLYTVVDPGALDELFSRTPGARDRGPGRVHFEYAGYAVTVDSDGRVDLEEVAGERPAGQSGSDTNADPDGPVRGSTGN